MHQNEIINEILKYVDIKTNTLYTGDSVLDKIKLHMLLNKLESYQAFNKELEKRKTYQGIINESPRKS